MATDLLFAYGTLMRGFALHRVLAGRAEFLGAGTVAARLLDLGSYPAAARDPHGRVTGEVYRITAAGAFTALDSVEGPQYHREETRVRMVDGREIEAFVYWYTGPLGRGVPIPGGDYRAHAPARSIHRTTSRGGHDAA
jgi:gamma-glutamylaminecyclotransferase